MLKKPPVFLYGSLLAGMLALAPLAASAALVVEFQATPLFSNTNIAPGDSVTRTVKVTNTLTGTSTDEAVYATVANQSSDGLADTMMLDIASSSVSYFTGTLGSFFAASPVALGTLAPGESRIYTFTASFPAAAGNDYQNKTARFDLVIGFQGGQTVTDNDNNGGGGGGPSGGRRGGGGGGPVPQVAGAATSTAPGAWQDILDGLRQAVGDGIGALRGAILGMGTTTIAEATSTDILSSEAAGTTSAEAADEGRDWCQYSWLLVIIWLLVSAAAYWRTRLEEESVAMIVSQAVFFLVALALLLLSFAWWPCVFWPALITMIGSAGLYFLSRE